MMTRDRLASVMRANLALAAWTAIMLVGAGCTACVQYLPRIF